MSGRALGIRLLLLSIPPIFLACASAPNPESADAPAPPVDESVPPTVEMDAEEEQMHGRRGVRGEGMREGGRHGEARRGEGRMRGHGDGDGGGARGGMAMHGEMNAFDVLDPPTEAEIEAGSELYEAICSACHSIDPPMKEAPPFRHVARHLRQQFEDRAAFTTHVVDFVTAPSAEHSALPQRAIERFGLMPAHPIGSERLESVAAYLWSLTFSEGG